MTRPSGRPNPTKPPVRVGGHDEDVGAGYHGPAARWPGPVDYRFDAAEFLSRPVSDGDLAAAAESRRRRGRGAIG